MSLIIPNNEQLKLAVKYTLQILITIFIALEISIPPNPYKIHLLILLISIIALKYNITSRIINTFEKYYHIITRT